MLDDSGNDTYCVSSPSVRITHFIRAACWTWCTGPDCDRTHKPHVCAFKLDNAARNRTLQHQPARAESISSENTKILITHMYRRCVIELCRWTPLTGAGSRQTTGWPWVRLQGLGLILSTSLSITGLHWLVTNLRYFHLVNTHTWHDAVLWDACSSSTYTRTHTYTHTCISCISGRHAEVNILFQCALYLQYRSPITLCGQGTSKLYTLQWNTSGGWSPPSWNFGIINITKFEAEPATVGLFSL